MKKLILLFSWVLLYGAQTVAQCHAEFVWEQIPGTLTIHFLNQSTSEHDITSYQWNFGDGHMGDGQNPNHTYAQPGTYNVCLIIHDSEGCVSDICHQVTVAPVVSGCHAGFNWEQIPNTLQIHYHSTSTSEHDITSYMWNFGDGHTGDGQNPYHTYEQAGVYVVCLTITDNTGCTDTECHEVTVAAVPPGNCHAEFEWEQYDNSLAIDFFSTSTSEHDIISYQWNFGDGHMGDGPHPTHTYQEPGVYVVCLIITDNTGCVSDVCHEVTVEPVTPGNCHAGFNWEQIPGTLQIHYHSTSTSEHDITSYMWNFGDGHMGDAQNPYHTYEQSGTYLVCLTITDNTGCTDTECHEVTIEPITPGNCEAGFTWEQVPGTLQINFHNTSTSEHDITSYLWNFGDGHMGDGQNPHHTYEQPGVYVVCLTITDNTGCVSTICHEVTVDAITPGNCEAGFNWEQLPGTLTLHFHSTSTSEHDITSYQWNFGDGHMGDGQNPYHHYEQSGVFVVCLIITDNTGCTDTVCHEVTVEAVPFDCQAGFTWEQVDSLTIHFNNTSTSSHDITSYQWNFGDGHMGDGQNPTHHYEEPGVYEVCLTIHDNIGCESTICHEIALTSPAIGEAYFGLQTGNNGNSFFFTNQSKGVNENVIWFWEFGDGGTSNAENPQHNYSHPGVYTVCLTMLDTTTFFTDKMCVDIMYHVQIMQYGPAFGIVHANTPTEGPQGFAHGLVNIRYTNPVRDELSLYYDLDTDANISIALYDFSGKRVLQQSLTRQLSGSHEVSFSTLTMIPGVYALHLTVNNEPIVRTILIAK